MYFHINFFLLCIQNAGFVQFDLFIIVGIVILFDAACFMYLCIMYIDFLHSSVLLINIIWYHICNLW